MLGEEISADDINDDSRGEFGYLRIAKGYSRNHRPEFNQMILNLICENRSGIPVHMKPAGGNSNGVDDEMDTSSEVGVTMRHYCSVETQ